MTLEVQLPLWRKNAKKDAEGRVLAPTKKENADG